MPLPADTEKGRPPRQGSAPHDLNSSHITRIRVTDAEAVPPEPGRWKISDLPPGLAKRVRSIDPDSGCWRVSGHHDPDGYTYYAGQGAHRAAYEHCLGPIAAGRQIDHVRAAGCRFRDCVNVNGHLAVVTPRVNTLRGSSFSAVNALKDRCGACGAEYDLINTYYKPDGGRDCRVCIRRRVAEYRQRHPDRVRETRRRSRARARQQRGELATLITLTEAGFTPEAASAMLRAG